jgi:hypothetical protein
MNPCTTILCATFIAYTGAHQRILLIHITFCKTGCYSSGPTLHLKAGNSDPRPFLRWWKTTFHACTIKSRGLSIQDRFRVCKTWWSWPKETGRKRKETRSVLKTEEHTFSADLTYCVQSMNISIVQLFSVNITKISNLGCGLAFCFQESQADLSPCVSYKVAGVLKRTARDVSRKRKRNPRYYSWDLKLADGCRRRSAVISRKTRMG